MFTSLVWDFQCMPGLHWSRILSLFVWVDVSSLFKSKHKCWKNVLISSFHADTFTPCKWHIQNSFKGGSISHKIWAKKKNMRKVKWQLLVSNKLLLQPQKQEKDLLYFSCLRSVQFCYNHTLAIWKPQASFRVQYLELCSSDSRVLLRLIK